MRVTIPVSVGELIDKITILEIKSLFSDDEYIIKELNELNRIKNTITSFILDDMNDLREVNRKLWKIEDRLRELEKQNRFDDEFIELARNVYKTNDRRAEIKRKINENCNSEFREVKIYFK